MCVVCLLQATWCAGDPRKRMVMILILIVRLYILRTSVYTVKKFLRLRCSSADLTVALFLFAEYNLAIALAVT